MKRNKNYIIVILFILYIAVIFYGCLYNFSNAPLDLGYYFLGIPLDKFVHFLMFFPYPFISWFFLRFNNKIKISRDYYFTVIIFTGILLGILTECSQSWLTTYRQGDATDLGADILGILAGSAVVFSYKHTLTRLGNKILGTRLPYKGIV